MGGAKSVASSQVVSTELPLLIVESGHRRTDPSDPVFNGSNTWLFPDNLVQAPQNTLSPLCVTHPLRSPQTHSCEEYGYLVSYTAPTPKYHTTAEEYSGNKPRL